MTIIEQVKSVRRIKAVSSLCVITCVTNMARGHYSLEAMLLLSLTLPNAVSQSDQFPEELKSAIKPKLI